MDNLLTVALEAHNPERNHHRLYEIRVGRDLFDQWTVSVRYARVGQYGHEVRFAGPQIEPLTVIVQERLRQRLSAPRRIGCSYRLAGFSAARDIEVAKWVPGDLLTRFAEAR